MNNLRSQPAIDLTRPTPTLRRWMHRVGWLGVVLAGPAMLVLGWEILPTLGDDQAVADVEVLKWSARVAITGLLLGAIGFWDY